MTRTASEKIGRGVCPSSGCTGLVTYRKSSGGLITHRCDDCDSTGYAEPGGKAYAARLASIRDSFELVHPDAAAKPEPAPKDEPEPPAKTKTPAKKKPAFALADLE